MRILTSRVCHFSLAWLVVLLSLSVAAAQTTTFTYQGRLTDDYNQPTGLYDLQFNLYDEAAGTHAPLNATPVVIEDVQVTNGTFSVALDFGNLFNGGDRYVETGVRPDGDTGAFAVLSPRQRITSAPYSIRSLSASAADTATNAESLGGTAPGSFVQTTDARLTDARSPIAGSSNYIQNGSAVQSGADFNISGAGTASVFNATTRFNIGGTQALSIPVGSNSIFVGAGAGAASTTGINNLFLGTNAGFSNTSGSHNLFVGVVAGRSNTTGTNNSFFGRDAGYSNISGGHNAFFGEAGFYNTTGSYNSFLGLRAGNNNTSGSYNSFFGSYAGDSNGTGGNNTLIGSLADVTATGNLFFATAVGSHALVSTSNTIVLGKVAGIYDGVSRPADTVQIPGNLNVAGTISGTINGSGITNLNASNITTGTLSGARLGVVGVANGGTGLTSAGASGSLLRSNGTAFTSSTLQAGDVPDLSASYVRNQAAAAQSGGFNVSGNGTAANLTASSTVSGNVVNATTQFNLGGGRVLAVSGNSNLFAGINTGTAITTGIGNSFFGRNAGAANTEGIGNSFFGYQTGTRTTTGGDNSFFGIIAGNLNTTGASNSFFGTGAGEHNATGNNNSFFGESAGDNNSTGSNNAFFGYNAGASATSGNFNSLLGSNAQAGADNLSYATAVGARSVVSSSDTIVLGKIAGTYDGVVRPPDTVQIPGDLNVGGTISGTINGSGMTNLDANNIATGTLADARLSANVATLSGAQTFTGAKTFSGGVSGNGSGLTGLSASNITAGTLDSARLGLIPTANLADGAISTPKIADAAVTATKIAGGQVVKSINGLADGVSLLAGANVTITPSGNTLTISASAPSSVGNFIQNSTAQQPGSNFNISGDGTAGGTLSGNVVNATTQFNLGGGRVLSIAGSNNVFVGSSAGVGNGTGYNNAFFGYYAGRQNTAGSQNVFLGGNTGAANTTGSTNSFVGYGTGYANTSGNANTFFGTFAGYNNTTGFNNTFAGVNAGLSNTTGYVNLFNGLESGRSNTEGYFNSFVGPNSGYGNTTGYYNSFFGFQAGYTNTTGNNNTIVGTYADLSSNNLSFATAIGAYATVGTSNTIALGRSNGLDKVRIFGLGAAGSAHLCRNVNSEISTCSSSLRYKTNVAPFSPGLGLLRRLRPIRFEWKDGGMKDIGFGAEDVAAVEPLLVTYDESGRVEGVKYDRIPTVLVNAVKEQQAQIDTQQSQLTQQQAQIEAQQQQLRQQQILIDGLKKLLCRQDPNADICR